ncbi:MAG: hypothetical protein ACRD0G_01895 [Acidimicrobiales bacterium]
MLTSAALAVVIVASGYGLTTWIGIPLRGEERLFIGVIIGVLAFVATSLVVFLTAGMAWPTVLAGVAVPSVAGAAGAARHRAVVAAELASVWQRLRRPTRAATSLRPLAALTVVAGAVTTRTLALAYQTTPTGISAGSLATWSDWSAHLAYAGSFAYGDNRDLELPLAAGTPLRYHFLANFFGSLITVTGLTLPRAMVLSAWVVAIALPPLLFCFVLRLSGSRFVSGLTVILFTLTGGIGAWYFLVDVKAEGWEILRTLPRTYARIGEQHLWVDNTISASLYAQRSTLLGLATGCAAGILLLASRPRWQPRGFLAAGLLVGLAGLIHVHLLGTALALGALGAIADRRRTWWWFLVPAATVGVPLAWAIRPPTSSMRWMVGWMATAAEQPWIWFWLRNVGLLLPLFLAIGLLGGAPRRIRRLTAPLWLWFAVPNLVAFHPAEWNNTKFFLFWQLAACIAIAAAIRQALCAAASRSTSVHVGAGLAATVTVAMLISAGGLDALRAMQRSTAIPWVDADDAAAAGWLRDHARPGARLVYGAHNTSAVAALSGVPALSGYPGWTWDLGLPDWAERVEASRAILAGASHADALIERYGIRYVVIGPRERREMNASDSYWDEHGTLVLAAGDYRVYLVGDDLIDEHGDE